MHRHSTAPVVHCQSGCATQAHVACWADETGFRSGLPARSGQGPGGPGEPMVSVFSSWSALCYNFPMCAESKILTGLLERRALDTAIGELAGISDPIRLAERAESIAQHGRAALAALVSALDTSDPQLRGGLGAALVALRLPREQVVTALRAAARAHERGVQARLTALTILERFFDEPPDQQVLDGLRTSDEIAMQSLDELMQVMAQDPLAILEYLAQLGEQPPEVPRMILAAIPAAPFSAHHLTLLRMFAQDPDLRLAGDALEELGRIRKPGAARALAALGETLPPSLASLAMRGVRKLRLSGVAPADGDGVTDWPWLAPGRRWRALLSPVDGAGAQLLWFIGHAPTDERAMVLSVMFEDTRGVTIASGALDMALAALPPASPSGSLHRLAVGQHMAPLLLLEVPIEVGRRALREALVLNWNSGTPTPLAYRLLNLPVWLAEPAQAEAPPAGATDSESASSPIDPQDTAGLLDHPAFWGWAWPVDDWPHPAAGEGAGLERADLVTRVVQSQLGPGVEASYQRRLQRMAEWLELARDAPAAALARAAADQLRAGRPEEAPFLRRLVDIGLQAGELAHRQRRPAADPVNSPA